MSIQAQITHWSKADFIKGEVKVAMLNENDASKEIQIIMGEGGEMKKHKAPAAINVQVLLGEIDFEVFSGDNLKGNNRGDVNSNANNNSKIYRLKKLDMISLEANIAHSLKALKDSIIRLSLAKSDSIKRVNAVIIS